jgi:Flp pilus assembly secretin CpaC
VRVDNVSGRDFAQEAQQRQLAQNQPAAPAAAAAQPSTPPPAAPAGEDGVVETIRRAPGERYFLPEMRVENIFVSNPSAISAVVRDTGIEVTFVGRGTSDLEIFRGGVSTVYRFITVTEDVDRALDELRRMLSGIIGVNIERVGDSIVATGRILTQADATRFELAIERYDVVDLVERQFLQVEQEQLLANLREVYAARGFTNVTAELRRNNRDEPFVVLGGRAYSDLVLNHAEELASSYFDNVTNQIILDKPEVQLDVILATFDLDKVTGRGREGGPFTDITLNLGTVDDPLGGVTMNADLNTNVWDFPNGVLFGQVLEGGALLRLLKTESSVVNFVEAFSVVKSGDTATFHDGGSILVPLVGSESQGVATIDTGLVLTMTPVVEDSGKIGVFVAVDFTSETEDGTSFQGGDENNPGTLSFKTARTSSTVSVANNQAVVVSGINANLYARNKAETPLLGKIPIVNLFFKTQSRRGNNVRSYFFITPRVPTLFDDNTRSIAQDGETAREHFRLDSTYVIPGPGFYLGWDNDNKMNTDVPPPPWERTSR